MPVGRAGHSMLSASDLAVIHADHTQTPTGMMEHEEQGGSDTTSCATATPAGTSIGAGALMPGVGEKNAVLVFGGGDNEGAYFGDLATFSSEALGVV